MTDRPIIFSAPMVRALLEGRKTQTRRIIKGVPDWAKVASCVFAPTSLWRWSEPEQSPLRSLMRWPTDHVLRLKFATGDRLWVRENWQGLTFGDYQPTKSRICDLRFAATDTLGEADKGVRGYPWRPSIHMPRWASRLTLIVTDVRVQRLQEITLGDICEEGLARSIYDFAPVQRGFAAFEDIWNSLHGPEAWDANPWVVALTFSVHRCNIDKMEVQK